MATKKAPRRRKELDITDEIADHYKKNFDCSNLRIKNNYPMTDNQQKFYYLSQNPKTNIIFLDGPAGSAKTHLAVFSALEMLKDGHIDKIIYVRSVVESSSKSMGFLKGDEVEKFQPYFAPMLDKLSCLLPPSDINHLITNEYVKAIPINFLRGMTFNRCAVIGDELQNFNTAEMKTLLSRIGKHTKYMLLADPKQSDIKDSGFKEVYDKFDQDFSRKNEIHCLKFDTSDIVRSPILKHIAQILGI